MWKRFLPMLAVALMWGAGEAAAQCTNTPGVNTSCSTNQTASLTINPLVSLDFSGSYNLSTPTQADLAAGYKLEASSPTLTVKANKAWTLSVSAAAANFSYTGSESGAKSRDALYWKNGSVGTDLTSYTQMSGTAAQVASGSRTNGATPAFFFGVQYSSDYSDAGNRPGTYTLQLTYTLAAS